MPYQVFENDKPAQYPDIKVHSSWSQSKFSTLEEAQIYLNKWLGPYGDPDDRIPLGKRFYYCGVGDFVVIEEVP